MKPKKIVIVCRIKNYETSEGSSRSMFYHDPESRKYMRDQHSRSVTFSKLIGEFKTDDLVRITMEKVGAYE